MTHIRWYRSYSHESNHIEWTIYYDKRLLQSNPHQWSCVLQKMSDSPLSSNGYKSTEAHISGTDRHADAHTRAGMQQQQQGPSPQIGRMLIWLTWEGVGVAESVCARGPPQPTAVGGRSWCVDGVGRSLWEQSFSKNQLWYRSRHTDRKCKTNPNILHIWGWMCFIIMLSGTLTDSLETGEIRASKMYEDKG